jgi:DNA (cytosine-5)-methyltransferase 1
VKWNYLDLFSGIGGFRLGLERAGFEWGWTGHSEIDKYANKVYNNHWKSEDLGDVRTITVNRLPRINLITFGFPCQDLSIAGKRGGLQANRSGLFFEAMRIVRDAKPDYFIFENVKGLFSSNGGFDWLNVLREVADSGYDGQWQLLNTRWFLPQNRERVYFVGYPSGRSRPEIFPIGENIGNNDEIRPKKERQEAWSCCLNSRYGARWSDETYIRLKQIGQIGERDNMGQRVYSTEGNSCSIRSQGGGQGAKTGLYEIKVVGNVYEKGGENGQVYDPSGICRTIKSGETDNPDSGGIGSSNAPKIMHERRIRRLTPTECARLQGFPDSHCDGLSDTQAYKCYGNAVTVDVVKAIGERLINWRRRVK